MICLDYCGAPDGESFTLSLIFQKLQRVPDAGVVSRYQVEDDKTGKPPSPTQPPTLAKDIGQGSQIQ
jgi:hypothetical protein